MVKEPQVIHVGLGLNLSESEASILPGQLVRAKNKAPARWGPRHGTTFIDKQIIGSNHPDLNGTNGYLTAYYNATQMDLGRKFSIDFLGKVTTLPTGGDTDFVMGHGDANRGAWFITIDENGKIQWHLKDDDDNMASVPSSVSGSATHSDGDVLHTRLTRSDGTFNVYVDTVLEGTDTASFTATAAMKVLAENVIVAKTPGHSGGLGYFDGVFAGCYIRTYVDTDFTYAYADLPHPKSPDVLAAWNPGRRGGVGTKPGDVSRYGNHMVATNGALASRVAVSIEPVQFIKNATTLDGRMRNIVMAGGRLYTEVV